MSAGDSSLFLPTFLQRLAEPSVKTVLLCGCGGGFDFVHSLILVPELRRLGKSVVIGSYSFGDPSNISGQAEVVFQEGDCLVKKVCSASAPDLRYGPEVHACSFLDEHFPDYSPHEVYAYYARAFTVPTLTKLYRKLVREHAVDAVVIFDGGSDSLMVGDEEGLGDPIEDAVSVASVAALEVKTKILISIGLGADRFNHVSDASSLRAVAELTQMNGFLGSVSLEPTGAGYTMYRRCLEYIYRHQTFRSVLAGTIAAAAEGCFGINTTHELLPPRALSGSVFLWPLMSILWAFEVDKVAQRSKIAQWIRGCETVKECYLALHEGRSTLQAREVEDLPRHKDMRCQ